jgi:SAM-dependent methyltransferase
LSPTTDALEYGCGSATLSRLLAPHVGRITAADSSAKALEEAGRNLDGTEFRNVRLLPLDLTRDEPPPARFDLVLVSMALHHISDTEGLLERLVGLLRPEGWIVLADLYSEDGSFHTDVTVPHHGFEPAAIAGILERFGLEDSAWREVFLLERNGRNYPIFLLTGRKPAAG